MFSVAIDGCEHVNAKRCVTIPPIDTQARAWPISPRLYSAAESSPTLAASRPLAPCRNSYSSPRINAGDEINQTIGLSRHRTHYDGEAIPAVLHLTRDTVGYGLESLDTPHRSVPPYFCSDDRIVRKLSVHSLTSEAKSIARLKTCVCAIFSSLSSPN